MKLLRRIEHIPEFASGTVVTIGNFDGVHRGHQALLRSLRAQANEMQLPMVVMVFEPQPGEYFKGEQAPARLSSLREKINIFNQYGVDFVFALKFDQKLASMPAEEFAQRFLFSFLNARHVLIGEDFRFGCHRYGDVKLLKELGYDHDCSVETFPDFFIQHQRVSSTKIRHALEMGQLDSASDLLGCVYSMCGRVVHGEKRGRQWGIPTANVNVHHKALPLKGVFYVQVKRESGALLAGVANIGSRPTVDGTKNILEVHLFDFEDSLYGEMLHISFIYKIRDEKRFPSVEALIAEIRNDIAIAKTNFYRVGTHDRI